MEYFFRTSAYGITDKNTVNDDIKFRLVERGGYYLEIEFKKGIDAIVDGVRINGS